MHCFDNSYKTMTISLSDSRYIFTFALLTNTCKQINHLICHNHKCVNAIFAITSLVIKKVFRVEKRFDNGKNKSNLWYLPVSELQESCQCWIQAFPLSQGCRETTIMDWTIRLFYDYASSLVSLYFFRATDQYSLFLWK